MADPENGDPAKLLAEFDDQGEEYRYRDQLMVQEFHLSIVAVGVVFSSVWNAPPSANLFWTDVFVVCFLCILAMHMGRLNQDRISAFNRRKELVPHLGFLNAHGAASGKRKRLVNVGIPNLMIWFVRLLIIGWAVGAVRVAWDVFPQVNETALRLCAVLGDG
jgi:hypothetical protein